MPGDPDIPYEVLNEKPVLKSAESKVDCPSLKKPEPSEKCSDWRPVEQNDCVIYYACIQRQGRNCPQVPQPPPSTDFCKRFIPYEDENGCIIRYFCVPITYNEADPDPSNNDVPVASKEKKERPSSDDSEKESEAKAKVSFKIDEAKSEEKKSSNNCQQLGKPEPNRHCQAWEAIEDPLSGCISKYGCIPRPPPDCPPTKVPPVDDSCLEWEPIEDENYCITGYQCVIREAIESAESVARYPCEKVERPNDADCSKWKAKVDESGCIVSFKCLSTSVESKDREIQSKEGCITIAPPQNNPIRADWEPVKKGNCTVNYKCITHSGEILIPALLQSHEKYSIANESPSSEDVSKAEPTDSESKEDPGKSSDNYEAEFKLVDKPSDVPASIPENILAPEQVAPDFDENSIDCPEIPPPDFDREECEDWLPVRDENGCVTDHECVLRPFDDGIEGCHHVAEPRKVFYPHCADFNPIKDQTNCIVDYECIQS